MEVAKQDEAFAQLRIGASSCLVVSRLDKNADIGEFRKISAIIPGKAKQFYSLARYSDSLLKRQFVVGGFDSVPDKRSFINTFKLLYPEYLIQETSKILKFFCMTTVEAETECDWREYF